jgi:hypothetical protein
VRILGASYATWTLFVAALNLLVVVVAAVFGLRQIRQIGMTQRLETAKILQQVRDRNNQTFSDFIMRFPLLSGPEEASALTDDEINQARQVSDAINDLAELLDHRLLDRRIFFDLFHTQVIRTYFILDPFLRWERQRIGGRYGLRTEKIAQRCKMYHNIHPLYSSNPVVLPRIPPVVAHASAKNSLVYQHTVRRARWHLAIY